MVIYNYTFIPRSYGRTNEMVLEIKKQLEEYGECGVGLMSNPNDILKKLERIGVNASAEPAYRTMPPIMKFDVNGEPTGVTIGDKVKTGYVFYLKK